MTNIIESLNQISKNYNVLFCDIWGCIHNGKIAFPQALKALYDFKKKGGYVMLLTNAPRPKAAVQMHLMKMGITRHFFDDITTSGDAAQVSMFSGTVGYNVFHLGPKRDDSFFTDIPDSINFDQEIVRVPLKESEGIVCTGLFDDNRESPKDYVYVIEHAIKKSLKLLCVNPDIFVDVGDKRVWCAGGIAEAFSTAGGESIYCGKPHEDIYKLAYAKLKQLNRTNKIKIICVGDGINTDILGGHNEQLDTLFVCGGLSSEKTGITKTNHNPDPKKLGEFILENKIQPTASIGFLQ
jgi:HAD superfamily hydrolase (TIGR01459 family)